MKTYLFLATIFLFTGCQENIGDKNFAGNDQDTSGKITAVADLKMPDNADNPFDSVGREHNRVLDSVLRHIYENGGTNQQELKRFFHSYFEKEYGVKISKLFENVPADSPRELLYDYVKVVASFKLDPVTSRFLQEAYGTIIDFAIKPFPEFKQKIMTLEARILRAEDLDEKSRAMLLMTTSLARHSCAYWNYILYEEPGASHQETKVNWFTRSVAFLSCVIGDASGAAWAYALGSYTDVLPLAGWLSTTTWYGMTLRAAGNTLPGSN